MLTLKQLRYFEALSRLRHFGRAAQECAISQPALSMKIQELKARLGLALVERRRNGVMLTSAGEEIARRARSILTSVRDLSDYARNAAGSLSGKLVLGAIPSIAPYLLPAALPLVRARHPALELTLRETQTSILVGELLAGALDTVLLSLPIEHPEIATFPLFTDRFVLAARRDQRFDKAKPLTPEILIRENLLLLEDGHCLRDQALNLCQSARAMRDRFGASSLANSGPARRQWLRHHAPSGDGRADRGGRGPAHRDLALRRAAAVPLDRAGVAAHFSASGRLQGARRDPHRGRRRCLDGSRTPLTRRPSDLRDTHG